MAVTGLTGFVEARNKKEGKEARLRDFLSERRRSWSEGEAAPELFIGEFCGPGTRLQEPMASSEEEAGD